MEGHNTHQILTNGIDPDNSLSSSQSSTSISLTREDIYVIYKEGPEAVSSIIFMLTARIAELEERIKALEDQINKNSRNSSKPPSTDAL